MPEVTIVYWRDIPAQVIVGKGRRGAKRQLPERFEQEGYYVTGAGKLFHGSQNQKYLPNYLSLTI